MFHLSQLSSSLSASTTQVINGLKTLCTKKVDSTHEVNDVICNESLDEVFILDYVFYLYFEGRFVLMFFLQHFAAGGEELQ